MTQNEFQPTDITPNKDGGVIKQIIKEGEGNDSPVPGDKVKVHYVGTLDDGAETQFDSSRDRGEQFEFDLGKGSVIKAWDIGVATMKKGEIAKLTCKPEYAYGATGAPPKIPANATLIFEVELFEWKGEDISEEEDGSIIRHITTKGKGYKNPNDNALVKIHYVGRYKENVFEDREVEFTMGEGDAQGIVEGVEEAAKKMKEGEKCRLDVKAIRAYGSQGKPEFNIPPDADLHYDVEMLHFEKAKDSWEMDIKEKLQQAEVSKSKGTKYFKEENFKLACKCYEKVIKYLEFETVTEEDDKAKRRELMLAAHLNVAMCKLKTKEWYDSKKHCEKALEFDPNNVKGFFRKAQAEYELKDWKESKADYQKVLELEPANKAAKNGVLKCEQQEKKDKEREKKLYQGIFSKMAKENQAKESERPQDGFAEIGEWDNSMARGMLPLDRECEAFGEKMPERAVSDTCANGLVENDKQETPKESKPEPASANGETESKPEGDTPV
ncbi:hypothetical protein FSP39_007078 [Pinctada imbricata]|uniref:peptidylprolyl isomerase n=1 Tax=Pinctada imbricata TaxID=66713 RepID=A0AA88YMX6_PINIB|nr:hypothetical protein FSP39_007078 [Pinctada imbricata]